MAFAREPVVVRSGDTLTEISRRHGVAIETIVELNGLANPNRIFVGQRLRLEPAGTPQAPATSEPAAADARSHVVQPGEHLTGIARRYGVSIQAIVAANAISDPSRIYAGQRLVIPGGDGGATPATPAAQTAPMPADMASLVRERAAVGRVVVEAASRHGVPVAFAMAVAWQESGWRQGVVSHAGAIGVMQLLPSTAAWIGDTMLGTRVNPHDLRQNVSAGVRLLAHYLDWYDGDRALTLAAYYQGPTALARHGVYPVSRAYIASVRALEALFSR